MAIGNQITQNSINSRAGALAVRLRNLAEDTADFSTATGALTLTAVGFTSGDATAMNTAVAKMRQLETLYYGGIAGGSPDNYDADLAVLRGLGAQG